MSPLRYCGALLALVGILAMPALPVCADDYPSRPVKVIVPFGAGGPTDVFTRAIADELSKSLPEWVWLTQATFKNQVIQLRGKALNNNLIADFIRNLEGSPHFRLVNMGNSTQRTQGRNRYYEFALAMRYFVPQPPPPEEKTSEVTQ